MTNMFLWLHKNTIIYNILYIQIVIEDYQIGTDAYKGVFHCRFWRLGEWEDVYIDDCLPYRPDIGRQWGTHSATDPNEMWMSLMEKALAK